MKTPGTAPSTSRPPGCFPGRLLSVLLCVLTPAAGVSAENTCHPEYQSGPWIWYSVETQQRVSTTRVSGCTTLTGARPQVLFLARGLREVIACDLELPLPPGMKAELDAAQLQGARTLPSRRPTLVATWRALVRKYSPLLRCEPGFRRMSDASSGVPSVWCRRELTARELCPSGTTFSEGTCSSMACPAGTVDLDVSTGGKLSGCSRCPAGQLDVAESLAWKGQSPWASAGRGPVTAILCRARATDPCPAPRVATPAEAAGIGASATRGRP